MSEPAFVICKRCHKEAMNAGRSLCVACSTLVLVRSMVGLSEVSTEKEKGQ